MEEMKENKKIKRNNLLIFLVTLLIIFVSISSFLLGFLSNEKNGEIDQFIEDVTNYSYKDYDINEARVNALNGLLSGIDKFTNITTNDYFSSDIKKFDFDFKYDKNYKNKIVITNSLNSNSSIYPLDLIYGIEVNNKQILFESIKEFDEYKFIEIIRKEVKPFSNDYLLLIERNNNKLKVKNTLAPVYEKSIITKTIKKEQKTFLYIKLPNFIEEKLVEQISLSLKDFEKVQTEKELVLDLTNNGGGSVLLAQDLISLFIQNDNDVLFRLTSLQNGKVRKYENYKSVKKPLIDTNYKINILANENTASASELFITVLQSFRDNVFVYGKKTYGKNLFQEKKLVKIYNQDYYLTITGGYWQYFDKKEKTFKVLDNETNPIKIIEKEFSNYLLDKKILFEKEIKIDEVSLELKKIQEYINDIYNENLRTDGYFDLKTEEFIAKFQQDNNILVSKTLNFDTFVAFYDKIKLYKGNINNYKLLNSIIEKG